MSRLRDDDALLSLMDEMSSQQGYSELISSKNGQQEKAQEKEPTIQRVRLTAEVDDYPSMDKRAGASMIWNPFVKGCSGAGPSNEFSAPTNPQVEVLRRRAYERFKTEFAEAFVKVAINATTKPGPSNLWNDLAIPAMMERWHFDSKLQEFLMFRDLLSSRMPKNQVVSRIDSCCESTAQIKTAMTQHGASTMDPILISSDSVQRKKQSASSSFSPQLRSASSLLAEEIKFEWTRTWKRKAGDTFQASSLKSIFESSRFQKKLSRITRSIMDSAATVEASFLAEVTKRAAVESVRTGQPSKKSDPKIVLDDEQVLVQFSGLSFKVHLEHYRKLQIMFDRMNPNSRNRVEHEMAFSSALFCLLARYDMLQGAGLQSSMDGSVFDVLLKHYDCRLECFASPLNSRYEQFCSAFSDTDAPFGSVGSFFDYDFTIEQGGCFQANPPFSTNFIRSMYETMDRALQSSQHALMFVVFVPTWKETVGWQMLTESPHLRRLVTISQASHYYCEGTQHRRKDRYRLASFDTTVFFLQNDAASIKWPITDMQITELKHAFQSNPKELPVAATVQKKPTPKAVIVSPLTVQQPEGCDAKPNELPSRKVVPPPKSQRAKKRKLVAEGRDEGKEQLYILAKLTTSVPEKQQQDAAAICTFKQSRKRKKNKY